MASNVINRYVWLLNTLLQHKELSLKEISDLWKNSGLGDNKPLARRTFQMHREAVESLFNINIVYETTSNVYRIEDADRFKCSRACRWLLESFSVANLIQAGANMEERILFEEVPGGVEHLETVVKAMQQNRILCINYRQFGKEPKTLHFRPYAMKIYNRRWYVVGRASEGGRIINIALDRTLSMAMTDEVFILPEDFDAKNYYACSVGVYVNENDAPQIVKLRVSDIQREYLRTLPLHHSQEEEMATSNEYSVFRYFHCITPELTTQILAMGENVEVLEPQEMRARVKERAVQIANLYK
jgi:hypothetical protein